MRARKIPIRVIKGKILGAEVTNLNKPHYEYVSVSPDPLIIPKPPKLKNDYGVSKVVIGDWERLERKLNVNKTTVWSNLRYHIGKKLRRGKNVR